MISNSEDVEEDDKKHLKDSINSFIEKQFLLPRISLEKKDHLPHRKFRKYYSTLAREQIDLDEK